MARNHGQFPKLGSLVVPLNRRSRIAMTKIKISKRVHSLDDNPNGISSLLVLARNVQEKSIEIEQLCSFSGLAYSLHIPPSNR